MAEVLGRATLLQHIYIMGGQRTINGVGFAWAFGGQTSETWHREPGAGAYLSGGYIPCFISYEMEREEGGERLSPGSRRSF